MYSKHISIQLNYHFFPKYGSITVWADWLWPLQSLDLCPEPLFVITASISCCNISCKEMQHDYNDT